MSIASQIRHPNLVQFIGATNVGSLLIMTELMSTNFRKEFPRILFRKQQILSIAEDIALGLNYLHLFNPHAAYYSQKSKLSSYGTTIDLEGTVGNAAYASPEVCDPDRQSPAMDVYSYSVLGYQQTTSNNTL
uniref:Protein kinase domain-containing protein n=1 Tax=Amphimedon queenslandica TaxID=400682 RepID=A0A1X7SNH3_AMPQE